MPRRLVRPQSRHHVFLYDEDWDFISAFYSKRSPSAFGTSKFVREVVHQRVLAIKAKQQEAIEREGEEG